MLSQWFIDHRPLPQGFYWNNWMNIATEAIVRNQAPLVQWLRKHGWSCAMGDAIHAVEHGARDVLAVMSTFPEWEDEWIL